jgi:Ca2+-binding RTX toxin-like protein
MVGSRTQSFAKSSVSGVKVTGGSLADKIFLTERVTARTTLYGLAGNDSITGGGGNDSVQGGTGDDKIVGGSGNDTLNGNEGADSIYGQAGNDQAYAGPGNDYLEGNSGNDVLWGMEDNDTIYGGDGNDYLRGHAGTNVADGGVGDDDVVANSGSSTSTPPTSPPPSTGTPTGTPTLGAWTSFTKSNASYDAPQLVVKVLGQTVIAGQQIHANALSSTLRTGTILTAKFDWNFGDPGGAYNSLRGWNVAHAYEAPGTYTLALTVTDEKNQSTTLTTTIKVLADTRKTIYVAANGNDANDGRSPDRPVKSITRANKMLVSDNMKVLFRRGDTFSTNLPLGITTKNVTIGAYGSGNRPVITRVKGNGSSTISIFHNTVNAVVRDIVFDTPYVATGNTAGSLPINAITTGGTNTSIRGCEFRNVNYGIDGFRQPQGLLVQDNSAPLTTGVRGYLAWGEGSDHVYLGNYAANSTREHNIRLVNVTRMLLAFNDLTNLDRSSVDAPDGSKGAIEVHNGSYAYVYENKVTDGPIRVGPRGGSTEPTTTKTDWVVIERNEVTNTDIRMTPGAHHVFVRNNVISESAGSAGFSVVARDTEGRVASDIVIANNTVKNPGTGGKFLRVDGEAQRVTLVNNLFVMPNLSTGDGSSSVFVADDDLNGFAKIANNVWQKPMKIILWAQGGMNWVRTKFDNKVGYKTPAEWEAYAQVSGDTFSSTTISGWTPSSSSVAANFAVKIAGVFDDHYGKSRPLSGDISAGAVEV